MPAAIPQTAFDKGINMNIQDYYKQFFIYNPDTGDLIWKERPEVSRADKTFNKTLAGKKAGYIKKVSRSKTPYIWIELHGKAHSAHRIAFAIMKGYFPDEVDHIDHDGLNNKWENLRESNSKDNAKNKPMQKSNKSGYIGVNWHKAAKKWQARANDRDGKRIDLGRFDNIEDAIKARKDAEKEFGYYQHRGDLK